jgi:hypothetical protein
MCLNILIYFQINDECLCYRHMKEILQNKEISLYIPFSLFHTMQMDEGMTFLFVGCLLFLVTILD